MLLEKLVDDKLTPKQEIPTQAATNLEPVQSRRPSWSKIRQDYETKQRAAYWTQRIEEQERIDAAEADKKAVSQEGKK